jgi:hypothetical protein
MMPMVRCLLLLSTVVLFGSTAGAQPVVAIPDSAAVEPPGNVFVPVPIIYYTPETKLAFGLSAAYIYRVDPELPGARPSTIGAIGIYTLNNQVIVSVGGEHFFDQDRQQLLGGVAYQKFPNDFFGLGNDTSADDPESYTDEGAGVTVDYLRDLRPRLKIGGGVSIATSSITEVAAGDMLDGDVIPGSRGGQVLGVGVLTRYDSRDNIGYPVTGGFYQLSWRIYGDVLGADYVLNTTSLDLRRFFRLGERRVIGVRFRGVANGGTVPFQLMPALGGDQLLRGYFGGRFRERQLVALQSEYRSRVWKRLGLAVFGEIGQVARDLEQFGMDRFNYSYGVGLRFLLVPQERMNLRMDFGFGEDQSGFYLGFGEVF